MYQSSRLNSLPVKETPTHRIASENNEFSILELLAALFGGKYQMEIAGVLLKRYGSLHTMSGARTEELAQIDGVGKAKAVRLKAALELANRYLDHTGDKHSIQSPDDASPIVDANVNQFYTGADGGSLSKYSQSCYP